MSVVKKRGKGDCATAALAQFTGLSYEDVYLEVARQDPKNRGKDGLSYGAVIDVARFLGFELERVRTYDLNDDEGILGLTWLNPARRANNPHGHFVVVQQGCIICSDFGMRPWDQYLRRYEARPGILLREVE